jgi:hypothetical protein
MRIMDELARKVQEGERAKRKLERLSQLPDLEALADGTVLAATLGFLRGGKPYTYIGYKVEGRWYFTGGSTSPNKASSEEVAEWLTRSGRRVLGMVVLAELAVEVISVPTVDLDALLGGIREFSGRRVSGDPYGG